ncbi:MAG: hypothetical protein ABIJ09_02735 [Pseudomonadota bacterium]
MTPEPTADTPTTAAQPDWRALRKDLLERLQHLAGELDRVAADHGFFQLVVGVKWFWAYSVINQFWISMHRPDARSVRGRKQWEALGRTVKPGEEPIIIRAPNRPGRPWPLIAVEVFDISQTEGPDVPPAQVLGLPSGDAACLDAIEAAAGRLGVTIKPMQAFATSGGVVAGMATGRHEIQLHWSLQGAARADLLVHELAHALLHFPTSSKPPGKKPHRIPSKYAETEAEATAWVVLDELGLPSNAPSYIAWSGGKSEMLLRSMQRIQAAARAILQAIQGRKPHLRIPDFIPPPPSPGRSAKKKGPKRF